MRKNMVAGKIVCATQTRSFNIGLKRFPQTFCPCDVVLFCEPLNKQIFHKYLAIDKDFNQLSSVIKPVIFIIA